jgi:ABC-2 type transport system ATP-binding protein
MIETRGLTKRFGKLTAVDHLTLTIPKGEIFGLVGPDGAGKTTALRMLCGLIDPTEGEANVAGFNVTKNIDAVRDRIGYMAQRFGLYQDLTVEENMVFYSDLFGLPARERNPLMAQLLEMTRMAPFRDRPAGKLSGGMKQKLALMCTLLHHPQILLLDEPTNGVDPVSRRDFWAILYQLVRDGLTVLVSTAYLDEAERCNRVGLMNHGRLVLCDTPLNLKRNIPEAAYAITGSDLRAIRERLASEPGVLSVQPAGTKLHLFVDRAKPLSTLQSAAPHAAFTPLTPSLEDIFIAEVSRR